MVAAQFTKQTRRCSVLKDNAGDEQIPHHAHGVIVPNRLPSCLFHGANQRFVRQFLQNELESFQVSEIAEHIIWIKER